ncbi:hypothetical protein R6Q57_018822 [Mikania cordata]
MGILVISYPFSSILLTSEPHPLYTAIFERSSDAPSSNKAQKHHLRTRAWDSPSMAFCACGKQAIVRSSWTSKNPGRRFFSCPEQVSLDGFDPPMCDRSVDIIPGLLKSKNDLQIQLKASVAESKSLKKKKLIFSWIGFFVLLLGILMY